MNSKVLSIIRNEFLKYIRKPSFWFAMLGVPILLAVVSFATGSSEGNGNNAIPGLGDPEQISKEFQTGKYVIGFVDQSGLVPSIPSSFPPQTAELYRQFSDVTTAQQALANKEIKSFYIIPSDYIQKGELVEYTDSVSPFGSMISESLMETLLASSLYDSKDAMYGYATINPTANLKVEDIAGTKSNSDAKNEKQRQASAIALGNIFALLLYMSIFLSASWLLQALIEEKENRVMEVVLSSVRPIDLLRGKIIGLGMLGFFQLCVWLAVGYAFKAGAFTDTLKNITIPGQTWILAIICFILGFLIYGSMMAGIGSLANTVRESSQLTAFVVIPIIIPLIFLSNIVMQPHSVLAQVLSYIPLTSPITLLVRSVITPIPFWQIALSLGIMLLTVLLFQALAARMFRANTLLSGSKPSFKTFIRALKG